MPRHSNPNPNDAPAIHAQPGLTKSSKIEQTRTPNPARMTTDTIRTTPGPTQTPDEKHPRNRDQSRQTRTNPNT